MVLNNILPHLDGVKRTHKGFIAKCPSHEDRSPSLALREGDDGRVLLHCFSGCSATEVMTSIGMTLADLFPERINHGQPKRWTPDYKALCMLAKHSIWCLVLATSDLEKGRALSEKDLETVEDARRHLLSIWEVLDSE